MRKFYFLLLILMLACIGCQWQMRPSAEQETEPCITLERYDQVERLFLATGDIVALGRMNTDYPIQTRTLVEDVLQLGDVSDPQIKSKLYLFFQDSTLQCLLNDVEKAYRDMDDVSAELNTAFAALHEMLPALPMPSVYTQVSSLDQSIIVSDTLVGISLDKYLGNDYPLYLKYGYTEQQRSIMTREFIVPDCLSFYLLSSYPLSAEREEAASERHRHMGRIQYVVNRALGRQVFDNEFVQAAQHIIQKNSNLSIEQLLSEE